MIGSSFVSKEYIQLIHNSSDPADTKQTQQLSLDPVTWTEETRYVRGAQFRFHRREYLHQIYRDTAKRIYVKKGTLSSYAHLGVASGITPRLIATGRALLHRAVCSASLARARAGGP